MTRKNEEDERGVDMEKRLTGKHLKSLEGNFLKPQLVEIIRRRTWLYDPERLVVIPSTMPGYEIDLEEMTTSHKVLDWIVTFIRKGVGYTPDVGRFCGVARRITWTRRWLLYHRNERSDRIASRFGRYDDDETPA